MIKPQKALSFSLFGTELKYVQGAVENAWLAPQVYPGWDCVFHVERGHPVISELVSLGATVIEHDQEPGLSGAFWRFETLSMDYEVVVCRDADSRIHPRDKHCVDQWLASGYALHIMRDHGVVRPRRVPAGLFGIITAKIDIRQPLANWKTRRRYGDDERFLEAHIWRVLHGDSLIHRSESVRPGETPFPSDAPSGTSMGRRFTPSKAGMPVFRIGGQTRRSAYCVPRVEGLGKINGITTAHRNAAELIIRRGVFPSLLLEEDSVWFREPARADLPAGEDWLWVGLSRYQVLPDRTTRRRVTAEADPDGYIHMGGMLCTHGIVFLTEVGAQRMIVAADYALDEGIPIDVAVVELSERHEWSRLGLANPWVFQRDLNRKATRFKIAKPR